MLLVIIGLPRTGSSALSKIFIDSGINQYESKTILKQNSYEFNKLGYFEDTYLNLLNDNLIRYFYGQNQSVLYNKGIKHLQSFEFKNLNFYYDIDERTLEIPSDYSENLIKYTGHDWDVWGLTRMLKGKKWYKCYSKLKISDHTGLKNEKDIYLNNLKKMSKNNDVFIKDQRLVYLIDLWKFGKDTKFILLNREDESCLNSMRNHYGQNLFTDNIFKNFNWVSNHFNYKAGYQEFSDYKLIFDVFVEKIKNEYEVLEMNFNTNKFKKDIHKLSNFINKKLNLDSLF